MVSPGKKDQPIARYEAFKVLAEGCRHLARNCVTDGAKFMLNNFAESIEQEATEGRQGEIAKLLEGAARPKGKLSVVA